MKGSVVVKYKHWVQHTPPNCPPSTAPGDSITTYPSSIGYPALGSACTAVVSTCKGDGSGTYDVAPEAFSACVDQPAINGVCGAANGTTVAIEPSGAALCSAGTASAVTGSGPWNWTCNGQYGGVVSGACTANITASNCVTAFHKSVDFNPEPLPHSTPISCSSLPPTSAPRINHLSNADNATLRALIDSRLAAAKITAAEHTSLVDSLTNPNGQVCTTAPGPGLREWKRCVISVTDMSITYSAQLDGTITGLCPIRTHPDAGSYIEARVCDPPTWKWKTLKYMGSGTNSSDLCQGGMGRRGDGSVIAPCGASDNAYLYIARCCDSSADCYSYRCVEGTYQWHITFNAFSPGAETCTAVLGQSLESITNHSMCATPATTVSCRNAAGEMYRVNCGYEDPAL